MVTKTGKITMQNRYMGFLKSIPHSLRTVLDMFFMEKFVATMTFYQFLMMSDMPGRRPSIFSTGRAFTSNVFKSYWPLLFVAFHTA